MSFLLFLAAIMYLRVCYFMAVQIANSPIAVAIATLAARVFTSTVTAFKKIVLFVHLAVSTILRQLLLALLMAVALLVQAIWLGAFHAARYVLATSAARFMVATASTATHKVLTAMGSIAISIPILDAANGHITAWRLVHLRVGIQLVASDIATPSKQSMRIGVDDINMLTQSTATIENQLATTIKTKTAPAPAISTTTATAATTPTTIPTTLALALTTDDTLGVHVDASSNSAVDLPIVGSYKPVASRHLAIVLRSLVHTTVPTLPPCSSALSLVWHSTSPAAVPQATNPHTVSRALVSKRIELFDLFDLEATQASNEKVVDLTQAIGFKDDGIANDDDDTSDGTSDDTSSSTAEPESESELAMDLDFDLQQLGIEHKEPAQQAQQQQEHREENHDAEVSSVAAPSMDVPPNDKPTKTSWLLKLMCSGHSAKPRTDNKQRHATPAPRFSNGGSTTSNRFGMHWLLSPQAQGIYKQ